MPTPPSLPTNINAGGTTAGHKSHSDTVHGLVNTMLTAIVLSTKTVSYTAVLADAGQLTEFNSASALTFTIPANVFPVGTWLDVARIGAGTLTIVAGASVTIRVPTGTPLTLRAQYSTASLYCRAANEFVASGDLG